METVGMAKYKTGNLIEDEEGNIRPRVPQIIDARAPLADLSKNRPMTGAAPAQLTAPSVTPKAIWDEMFRKPATAITSPQPVSAFAGGAKTVQPLPSLTTMASGTNHAQRWMTPADGMQNVAKYVAPGTTPLTRYDNTAGTRTPFIAGKNGRNVAPTIAAKVNPRDRSLDPEFVKKFSWSSAFG